MTAEIPIIPFYPGHSGDPPAKGRGREMLENCFLKPTLQDIVIFTISVSCVVMNDLAKRDLLIYNLKGFKMPLVELASKTLKIETSNLDKLPLS